MSFPVKFMYNNEPMNMINKTPTEVFSVTGTLRDESSIVDPEIIIEHENPVGGGLQQGANYAYIGIWNRFYYIKDIVAFRSYEDENRVLHNLWKVSMHCDVLKTFAEGILGSPCIVAKTGGDDFNLYLPDPNLKRQQNDLHGLVNFPKGFDMSADAVRFYLTFFG